MQTRTPEWLPGGLRRGRLRIRTLTQIRWIAVAGQLITVLMVGWWMGYPLAWVPCLITIALSAWCNLVVSITTPGQKLASTREASVQIGFDILQLAALLYFTGGAMNPFAILLIAPSALAAATLPPRSALALVSMAIGSAILIGSLAWPLPAEPGMELVMPAVNHVGSVVGLVLGIVVTALYAWQASNEAARMELALQATQDVLGREQRLSALGSLAAAAAHELGTPLATIAVVAKELAHSGDPAIKDDAQLLISQAQRCRAILKRLSEDPEAGDAMHMQLPVGQMCEEIVQPLRDVGDVMIDVSFRDPRDSEIILRRQPEILHGLTAIVENAADFARSRVEMRVRCDPDLILIEIVDDGPGFAPDIIGRLGEPYVTSRADRDDPGRAEGGGLGLGFFIAKTLLERSGAAVDFRNARHGGASVSVRWPRAGLEFVLQPALTGARGQLEPMAEQA